MHPRNINLDDLNFDDEEPSDANKKLGDFTIDKVANGFLLTVHTNQRSGVGARMYIAHEITEVPNLLLAHLVSNKL